MLAGTEDANRSLSDEHNGGCPQIRSMAAIDFIALIFPSITMVEIWAFESPVRA